MITFALCTLCFSGGFVFGLLWAGSSRPAPLQNAWDHYAPYKEEPPCGCPDCRSRRLEEVE